MKPFVVRGLFLVAAFGVVAQAAASWWNPGVTVIRSSQLAQQPLAHSIPSERQRARSSTDPQGLLMLYQIVQGMRG